MNATDSRSLDRFFKAQQQRVQEQLNAREQRRLRKLQRIKQDRKSLLALTLEEDRSSFGTVHATGNQKLTLAQLDGEE